MKAAIEPTFPLLRISRLRISTDGEGITTLIAGAGCPLNCKWCLNAKVLTDTPTPVTVQALFDRVKQDDLYFQATGGGVTFGGGEALLHSDFIREFRRLCGRAWRIYAETSLHVPSAQVETAAAVVDGFIVDIKDTNPEVYHAYTGGSYALVEENLRLLLQHKAPKDILVRVPLIPEYNTPDHQDRSVQRLKELGLTRFDRFSYIRR